MLVNLGDQLIALSELQKYFSCRTFLRSGRVPDLFSLPAKLWRQRRISFIHFAIQLECRII